MAKFHFFTDIDLLNKQLDTEDFGPVKGLEATQYRVTSLHTASSIPKAYAVCSGTIVIQETSNSEIVNLILKPSEQPPCNLPCVKYYIYRGVLKSSICENDYIIKAVNLEDKSLIARISKSQANTNTLEREKNPEYQDVDPSFINFSTISELSYTNSLTNEVTTFLNEKEAKAKTPLYRSFFQKGDGITQLPEVLGGFELGLFDTVDFGIEIIVDRVGFEPLLELAALKENKIEVPIPASTSQKDTFIHWNKKEQILNYIDPCAFYGSFYDNELIVKTSNGEESTKKGNNIYSEVLMNGNKDIFFNKNKIYVDIRNELNYSYDYFRNYNLPLKIALEKNKNINDFTPIDYYKSNWPILIIQEEKEEILGFSLDNDEKEQHIKLSFPKGNNPNPIVYISQGNKKEKFSFNNIFKGKTSFEFLELSINNGYTNELHLTVPNLGKKTLPISTYIRLKYIKTNNSVCSIDSPLKTEIAGINDLENIFLPFNMVIPWVADSDKLISNVYHDEVFVDVLKTSGQCFMANVGVAKDKNGNVTLFTFSQNKIINNNKQKNIPLSIIGKATDIGDSKFFEHIAKTEFEKQSCNTVQLSTGFSPEPYIHYIGDIYRAKLPNFNGKNINDFVFITLSNEEYQVLLTTYKNANFIEGFNVHLGLVYDKHAIDQLSGIRYTKYEFVLRGYVENGDKVEVSEVCSAVFHHKLTPLVSELILDNRPPKMIGKGFSIITAIDGVKHINSTIYLYRGESVSIQEFCEYKEYFSKNIQQVWNSVSNNGLVNSYDYTTDTMNRPFNVDASNVIVKEATVKQLYELKNEEVVLLVEQFTSDEPRRSKIFGNRRTGVMFIHRLGSPDSGTPYFEGIQNVPAHEFGHILGLGDRYSYISIYAESGGILNIIANKRIVPANFVYQKETTDNGIQLRNVTSLFLEEDDIYSSGYNWVHNLMSGQNIVPVLEGSDNPIEKEPTFVHIHKDRFEPVPPIANLANKLEYETITVFITEKQFIIIEEYQKGGNGESNTRWLFFKKDIGTNPEFKGSFVGLENSEDPNSTIATDNDFVSGESENDFDHRMKNRCVITKTNPDSNFKPATYIDGVFYPYIGAQKFRITNPVGDVGSYLRITQKPEDYTYNDIEIGGNAFDNEGRGINYYRSLASEIINNVEDLNVPFIFNGEDQGETIQDIINKIPKDDNNTRTVELLNDEFENFGKGNDRGRVIWRLSTSNRDQYNPENNNIDAEPLKDVNSDDSYPYNFYELRLDGVIYFKIEYKYYLNRRAIFRIINENGN